MDEIIKHISAGSDRRPDEIQEIDTLRMRLDFLEGPERMLLELYLDHHASYYRLAKITGMNERYLARKVQRLLRCLQSEEYISILRHRNLFDGEILEMAYDRFLLGMSIRSISKKRKLSRYRVSKKVRWLEEWLEGRREL